MHHYLCTVARFQHMGHLHVLYTHLWKKKDQNETFIKFVKMVYETNLKMTKTAALGGLMLKKIST